MTDFAPFQNETQALNLGGLSVENRLDRVSLSGDVDLTMDRPGLEHARRLKAVLDAVVAKLEAERDLPAEVTVNFSSVTGPHNPFA